MERFGRLTAVLVIVTLPWLRAVALPRPVSHQSLRRRARPVDRACPRRDLGRGDAGGFPRCRLRRAVAESSGTAARRPQNTPQPLPDHAPPQGTPPRPTLGQIAVQTDAAPLEPTDLRFPINLATALQLSDARPLIVAAAQASVWVAEAQLTRAKVLWVPSLDVRRRLYPARRRRTGFQQGHPDRTERELLPGWWQPGGIQSRFVSDVEHHRRLLRAADRAAGPQFPAMGHSDRQERRPAHDGRCLLQGASISGNVCRRPLRRRTRA